jgi:aryl-alcohol dehydrogenase-like predicted oxidoreductase
MTGLPHRLLGRTGIRVSEVCLGTMTFGTEWRAGADEASCREIYEAFRQAGGNFVDTANIYTGGSSEEIVGRLVASERDSIVLATKFTLQTNPHDINSEGSHRKSLRRSIETSLRRLNTEYVDVLWVHAWDQCTSMEETLRALNDLVASGKVLAIGVSNTPAWVVAYSQGVAELRGWTTFCAMQIEYSLGARTADRELRPMARALGLALTAWSPLAGGLLSGKFSRRDANQPGTTHRAHAGQLSPLQERAMDVVWEIASEIDTTPARVALAWIIQQGLIPVLGARTLGQLQDNLGASEVRLNDAHLTRLDAATHVDLGYPHEFLSAVCPTLSPVALADRKAAPASAESQASAPSVE